MHFLPISGIFAQIRGIFALIQGVQIHACGTIVGLEYTEPSSVLLLLYTRPWLSPPLNTCSAVKPGKL